MKKAIKIKVVRGGIRVTPNSCKAKHLDQIKWQSNLPFIIYFGYVSPLNKRILSNNKPQGTVKYDARLYGAKKFKYIVAVYQNHKVLIKDPDLDIQP
jgi:hypothetical protein